MKKVLLITISVLLFLGLLSFGLYYFRDPVWDNNYEMSEYDYLDEYLYHYEDDTVLRGTLWVKYSTNGGNNFHLYPIDTDLDVKLPLLLKDKFEIDVVELNGEEYPVFLSLDFKQSEKNFIDEILCTYVKGNYCKRDVKLNSWRVYENTYPFPEIGASESLSIIDNNMQYYLDSNTNLDKFPIECSDLIAEYVYRKDILKEDVTDLISAYSNMECDNIQAQLDYAHILNSRAIMFEEFEKSFCSLLEEIHFTSMLKFFTSENVQLINSVCNYNYSDSDFEAILDTYDYPQYLSFEMQVRYLLYNEGDDSQRSELKRSLGGNVFSLQVYPGCLKRVAYRPELLYLTRILINE